MASSSRIKGITIEIDGETTGLQKALSNVTQESIDIQKELKDVDRLLKFDPGNTEALAQKQKLLAQQLEVTSQKLKGLKDAQEQVEQQFKSGDIGEKEYRSFQREVEFTEASVDKLRKSLTKVDDGNQVDKLKKDMKELGDSTDEAEDKVGELRSGLSQLVVGAATGVGISNVIEDAFDTSSLNTKLSVSMELDEGSVKAVKEAVNSITSYGVDAESALEGVRRQWALNKDASDESNAAVVKGAAAIVASYGDVDFTELIQETNELSANLGITDEQALGLVYSLLKVGFPPDQLDIITEYGSQLARAGYSAEEIQGIMAAGVETGTWNIDVLLDGLKEGRIVLAEFGQGVDKATADMFEKIGVSGEQLEDWGKAVANGGEEGKQAMNDVAEAISNVDDKTLQNQLGTTIWGTLWEENGSKITDTILGMNENLSTTEQNQNNLNDAVSKLNSDPMVQFQQAMADLKLTLAPLLNIIAQIIGKFAEWISNNPTLAATITAIVVTLSILIGILTGIIPLISTIITLAGTMSVTIGAVALPVLAVVAAIVALVAAGVLLYNNWDIVKAKAVEIWEGIKSTVSSAITGIVNFFTVTIPDAINNMISWFQQLPTNLSELCSNIANVFTNGWNAIVSFFTESIPAWIESIAEWFNQLPEKIAYALGFALGATVSWGANMISWITTTVPQWIDNIQKIFSELPGKLWAIFLDVTLKIGTWGLNILSWITTNVPQWINSITTFFSQLPGKIWTFLVQVVTNVGTWGSNMLSTATTGMQSVFNGIVNTFSNLPSKMMDIGKNIVAGIKNGIKAAWDGMVGWIGGLCDSFVDGVKDALDIHSPSRVMEALGEYTGQGFQVGIASTVGDISKQADALANAAIPNIKGNNYSVNTNGLDSSGLAGNAGGTLEKLLAKIDSLESAISNMGIYMDSTKVGKLVAGSVSNNMAFSGSRKGWK